MDQPTTDGVNTYFVSLAAQQAGLKAALSGLGGDELFGGYPSFSEIPRLVNALRPLRFFAPLARGFRLMSNGLLKHVTSPKYAWPLRVRRKLRWCLSSSSRAVHAMGIADVLDADFAREGWQELQTLSAIERDVNPIQSPRSAISCLESCWYMRNQLLRDSDWAGMAHSLEIRVPWSTLSFFARPSPGSQTGILQPRRLWSRPQSGPCLTLLFPVPRPVSAFRYANG
jgi:asparagine synthase (glutamine-hydrolysing)